MPISEHCPEILYMLYHLCVCFYSMHISLFVSFKYLGCTNCNVILLMKLHAYVQKEVLTAVYTSRQFQRIYT